MCSFVCDVSGCIAMVTNIRYRNSALTRNKHTKIVSEIGLDIRRRLVPVSVRNIFCLVISS